MIKITITRAKGEGTGHVYHIEVRDLPFRRIPFVSSFISLIDDTKKLNLLKSSNQNCDKLCGSKFAGQSLYSFAYCASFDAQPCAQPRALCAYNDNGRRLSSQENTSIART